MKRKPAATYGVLVGGKWTKKRAVEYALRDLWWEPRENVAIVRVTEQPRARKGAKR